MTSQPDIQQAIDKLDQQGILLILALLGQRSLTLIMEQNELQASMQKAQQKPLLLPDKKLIL